MARPVNRCPYGTECFATRLFEYYDGVGKPVLQLDRVLYLARGGVFFCFSDYSYNADARRERSATVGRPAVLTPSRTAPRFGLLSLMPPSRTANVTQPLTASSTRKMNRTGRSLLRLHQHRIPTTRPAVGGVSLTVTGTTGGIDRPGTWGRTSPRRHDGSRVSKPSPKHSDRSARCSMERLPRCR